LRAAFTLDGQKPSLLLLQMHMLSVAALSWKPLLEWNVLQNILEETGSLLRTVQYVLD
jgi:hypothetical protein